MARLKGISERKVMIRHAIPNAIVPAIQVSALQLAWMAGGVVVVEFVFNYPGVGASLVDAVGNRDVPTVQALTLIIAAVYVFLNLAADVTTILVTPLYVWSWQKPWNTTLFAVAPCMTDTVWLPSLVSQ